MYDLFYRRTLFDGKNDHEQIKKIFEICGTPNEQEFEGFDRLDEGAQKLIREKPEIN